MVQENNTVIDVTPATMISDEAKQNAIVVSNNANPALQVIDPAAYFADDYTEEVNAAVAQLGKIGDRIGVSKDQGGFVLPDGCVVPHIDCVILAYADANIYYERAYSEGDTNPPDCWSFDVNELRMKPSAQAPLPQCVTCADCKQNQFGSAVNGKGKKCQNTKSLVLMMLDNTQQLYRLKVSPTGLLGFKTFASTVLGKTNRPLFATPTRITLNSALKYASLTFKPLHPSEGAYTVALANAVKSKLEEAKVLALKEPEIFEEDEGEAGGGKKAPAKNTSRFAKK